MGKRKVPRGREDQLKLVADLLEHLEVTEEALHLREKHRARLDNHLEGLYEEIDKLAKGKLLIKVSDLILEQTNSAIKDTKTLISGDEYLDRIKEFVAAGDNPVYPDVVVVLRALRQAISRFEDQLDRQIRHVSGRKQEAATFAAALRVIIAGASPTKEEVQGEIGPYYSIDDGWFYYDTTYRVNSFSIEDFDRLELAEYLSTQPDGDE